MTLQEMKDIDIRAVDPATLVDITRLQIEKEAPKDERMKSYILRIKNPYCFLVGNTPVKLSFADCGASLTDRIESIIARA